MKIYLDADSCARLAREVLEKAQIRLGFDLVYVANRFLSPIIRGVSLQNQVTEDVDAWLEEEADVGSLVITRDILLSAKIISKGVFVMNDKGMCWNIKEISSRSQRCEWNRMLEEIGLKRGKTFFYSRQDKKSFASSLDRWLARNHA